MVIPYDHSILQLVSSCLHITEKSQVAPWVFLRPYAHSLYKKHSQRKWDEISSLLRHFYNRKIHVIYGIIVSILLLCYVYVILGFIFYI